MYGACACIIKEDENNAKLVAILGGFRGSDPDDYFKMELSSDMTIFK